MTAMSNKTQHHAGTNGEQQSRKNINNNETDAALRLLAPFRTRRPRRNWLADARTAP